jgi:hypothetical protein
MQSHTSHTTCTGRAAVPCDATRSHLPFLERSRELRLVAGPRHLGVRLRRAPQHKEKRCGVMSLQDGLIEDEGGGVWRVQGRGEGTKRSQVKVSSADQQGRSPVPSDC